MTDSITRIESADGPDRELDAAIWRFKLGDTTGEHWFSDGQGNVTKDDHAPSFTASIDAALTLVPDGWVIGSLDWWPSRGNSGVTLLETGTFSNHMVGHDAEIHAQARSNTSTPALALAAAALKARGV